MKKQNKWKDDSWIETTDVCVGDKICFEEAIFSGKYIPRRRYGKPKIIGWRTVVAEILKESYGAAKQQHTFTLLVHESWGESPISEQTKIRRKGRTIYRNNCERLLWTNEDERDVVVEEKHMRGDIARRIRAERLNVY